MPDPKEVAQEIIDLVFHTPHVDAGTGLEEVHLLESITDIIEEALDDQDRESRRDAEENLKI
jgi:hypothetical protein